MRQHEHRKSIQAQEKDALAKVNLLKGEIAFNDTLHWTLNQVQLLNNKLGDVKNCLAKDRFFDAIALLDEIQAFISRLGSLSRSEPFSIIQRRATETRKNIEEDVDRIWATLLVVDRTQNIIVVHSGDPSNAPFEVCNSRIDIFSSDSRS